MVTIDTYQSICLYLYQNGDLYCHFNIKEVLKDTP